MVRKSTLLMAFAMAVSVPAQTVSLSGRVSDPGGKAIAGAVVSLKSMHLADTTDAAGAYSLGGVSALGDGGTFPGTGRISFRSGWIGMELYGPQRVRIELFDLNGDLIAKAADGILPGGQHRFDAAGRAPDGALSLVRVSIGGHTAHFLFARGTAPEFRSAGSTGGKALAKTRAIEDALDAAAPGYKAKSVPITSYEGKVDITLEASFTGTCTESKPANANVKGSGSHSVVVETNSDDGIKEGTIFRPSDLGPGKKYPILVWGEGACSRNGLDNSASMAEIASQGYFVIADGTPGGTGQRAMNSNNLDEMGKPALAYITWAIAENGKPCSKYYQSLDTSKIAANGFSCGGLFAMGTARDPRITTWGLTSSGSFSNNPTLWNAVHTPVLIIEGNKDETGAYTNGLRDYNGIVPLGRPIMFFSHKNLGHGGDLWSANGGDFTRIHKAWLNWWLKGDTGATGKGALVGTGCTYCTNSNWEVKSANLP